MCLQASLSSFNATHVCHPPSDDFVASVLGSSDSETALVQKFPVTSLYAVRWIPEMISRTLFFPLPRSRSRGLME
jgi:hypothetical protein